MPQTSQKASVLNKFTSILKQKHPYFCFKNQLEIRIYVPPKRP